MKYAVEWMLSGVIEVNATNQEEAYVLADKRLREETQHADTSHAWLSGKVWPSES